MNKDNILKKISKRVCVCFFSRDPKELRITVSGEFKADIGFVERAIKKQEAFELIFKRFNRLINALGSDNKVFIDKFNNEKGYKKFESSLNSNLSNSDKDYIRDKLRADWEDRLFSAQWD